MEPAPARVMNSEANDKNPESYDRAYVVKSRRGGRWVALLAAGLAVGLAIWWMGETNSDRNLMGREGKLTDDSNPGGREAEGPSSVGTGGAAPRVADENTNAGTQSPAVIQEVETITGSVDGHELIGRRVNLHVPVQDVGNNVKFWVGPPDNRLLVVLRRDNRDGAGRQEGSPSYTGAGDRFQKGDRIAISGSIQKMPTAGEEMYSWGLTESERKELADRNIYIRADGVSKAGG